MMQTVNQTVAEHSNATGLPLSERNLRLWRAVQQRRTSADGKFVFAVRSTGIFCRPSCPAKRPSHSHVLFFATPEAASSSGFRPCRRCKPEERIRNSAEAQRVRKICEYISEKLRDGNVERLNLAELSREFKLRPHALERTFRRIMGISPKQFIDSHRMARLKSELHKGESVSFATYDAGYSSSSRVYERAAAQMGMTPAMYRRGGEGMQIAYTIAACPLGRVLVAATERGVSAVYLGSTDAELERALKNEYPRAALRRDRKQLEQSVNAILLHLRGKEPHLDLPLDVRATAFQRRVWQELQRIPYGETKSYTEVARAIGKPKAIRAVARACATNPVSIVVPCHRVVREDGQLAGYRWGLERKSKLLEAEKSFSREQK